MLGRRISNETVKNASAIFLLYGVLAVFVASLICRMENLPLLSCLYESISAIATVGLSLGITPHLNAISHILLMVLMFIGRIGGLTIIYATLGITKKATFKYPVGKITVG